MTPIKAIYNGIQDGPQPFELWTILEPMGCTCHGQFSSLSINTIHAHGFEPVEEKEYPHHENKRRTPKTARATDCGTR